jgi:uncharacterized protein (TIRG00374 family)
VTQLCQADVIRSEVRPVVEVRPNRVDAGQEFHALRAITLGIGAILLGWLAYSQRHLLETSGSSLETLRWQWYGPAVAAEGISLGAFALVHVRLLRAGGSRLGVGTVTGIAFAGNALSASIPIAGSEIGTAYTFRQFQRYDVDRITAAWVLTISGVVSSVTFTLVVGAAALATGNLAATFAGSASTVVVAASVGLAVVALRGQAAQEKLARVITRGAGLARRLLRRGSAETECTVESFVAKLSSLRLSGRDVIWAAVSSGVNWIADVVCLVLAISAAGVSVSWPTVVLAWAAGATVSNFPVTPGGLGIVEATMIAALVLAGVDVSGATVGVLAYRVISYWLLVLVGWGVLAVRQLRSSPERVLATAAFGGAA